MRLSTMTALAIPEDPYAIMTRGQLEARILDGDRAQATAPPEVSTQLRLTAQAEADAWHQSADAATAHDQPTATNAEALASQLAGDKTRLEAMNTAYEAWSARTSTARETAAQAGAELERRGHTRPIERPSTTVEWWRHFEADVEAMGRALEREHQAAAEAGQPWPPQHSAQGETAPAETAAVTRWLQLDGTFADSHPEPVAPAQISAGANLEAASLQQAPADRVSRLDTLQLRADEAAYRIAADNTEREARAQRRARLEREAQAQAEIAAKRQAEASDEIELEL
jgi:hypothetical protein